MIPSESLFILIKSLSQNEKRYFKVSASMHVLGEKNNYEKLFEAIDSQKVYDESKIKKKFADSSFINRLPAAKNYLYTIILKSLQSFQADRDFYSRLKSTMHQIKILFEKSHYKECLALILKAKEKAYRHENLAILLEILDWEKKVFEMQLNGQKLEKKLDYIFKEKKVLLKKLDNLFDYQLVSSKIMNLVRTVGMIRSKDDLKKFEKYITSPLMASEEAALTFHAKYLFCSIYSVFYYAKRDYKNSYHYLKKRLLLIDANVEQIVEETNHYLETIYHILLQSQSLKKYDEYEYYLKKLINVPKQLPAKNLRTIEAKIFAYSSETELLLCIKTGRFERGNSLIKGIEKGLQRFDGQIQKNLQISIYFNLSVIHFGNNNFSGSLKSLNKLLNDPNFEHSEDLYSFARIFNLILHFELKNQDLLEYSVKSTYRFLYKRKRLYRFESIILNFIRKKMPRTNTKTEVIQAFKALKLELEHLAKDDFEKNSFEYFDIINWLQSKIENKTFAEMLPYHRN